MEGGVSVQLGTSVDPSRPPIYHEFCAALEKGLQQAIHHIHEEFHPIAFCEIKKTQCKSSFEFRVKM